MQEVSYLHGKNEICEKWFRPSPIPSPFPSPFPSSSFLHYLYALPIWPPFIFAPPSPPIPALSPLLLLSSHSYFPHSPHIPLHSPHTTLVG